MTVSCSVVVPVHNEEESIRVLYERLTARLTGLEITYEIVFIDDGSSDRSLEILQGLHAEDLRVKYVALSRNFGHQVAVSAGLDYASGDAVIVMDADLQDPPEVVGELLARWRQGYDVVFAVRARRKGDGIFKRGTAALFYRVFRRITAVSAPLDAGDFRLMSRRAVDALRMCRERNRFVRGLAGWVGFRQVTVSYERDPRHAGETTYSVARMIRFAFDGIAAFSVLPLRLAAYAGLFFVIAGAGLFVYVTAVEGWSALRGVTNRVLVSVVLLVSGIQLLALWILGEYLWRIFEEARRRPLYIAAEAVGFEPRR